MLHMRVGSILYTKSMLLFLCCGPQCCGVFVCHGRCKRFWVSVLFSAVKSNIPNTPHMCKYLYIYIIFFISRYEVQLSQTWYWSRAVSMMLRLEQQLSIAKRLVCASRIWLATTWRFVVSVWHNESQWNEVRQKETRNLHTGRDLHRESLECPPWQVLKHPNDWKQLATDCPCFPTERLPAESRQLDRWTMLSHALRTCGGLWKPEVTFSRQYRYVIDM